MSFYGNQSAFYLLSNQLVSIGRTYGPDLIVPNIYRHSALVPNAIEYQQQQQQLASLQYQHQNLLLKQQQQPTVLNRNPAHHQHHRKGLVLDRELDEGSSQRLLDNDAKPTTSDSHSETSSETSDDSEEYGENTALNLHSEIKFSIDRILSGDVKCTQSFTCKSRVKTEHEIDDERSNKADADVDEQAGDGYPETSNVTSFEWLHCTRYQPPKLQRTYFWLKISYSVTKIMSLGIHHNYNTLKW
ncbi:hypothetical protein DPMN_080322 [Dreissena polymorpha]|uniref:Uncharacterized protein n=1 Tax=Dreissena polymorpha TaxID=45954 RepID=A0A9D3YQM7_DREPO|nr:hypothetical protein DPMN_080322 [Dreissena polymorpha]